MAVSAQTISITDLRAFAFTRDNFVRGNQDHVFEHSPSAAIFLGKSLRRDSGGVRMRGMGHSTAAGGVTTRIRVRLAAHSGSKAMAGPWDTHSTAPDDNTRLAEAPWAHYSGALVISDHDKLVNRGPEALASFVQDQTEEVMTSLVDFVNGHIHTTLTIPNATNNLNTLINANNIAQTLPGATYGNYNSRGISARGTAAASVSFASGSFAAQGIADMRRAFNNASEGMKTPNVIITEHDSHERYEGALQPQERFTGAVPVADGSFQALAFRTVPVLSDPATASGAMYFLRAGMDGIYVKVLEGADFSFQPFKMATNQEVAISELQWKGQLCIANRRFNNRLSGITD